MTISNFIHPGPKGFTIVELLIAIATLGILAVLATVGYQGVQDRTRAAALVNGFEKIDESLHLMAIKEGRKTWWLDADWWVDEGPSYTGPRDPTISDIMTRTNLKYYLPAAPKVSGMDASAWRYDNDANTYNPTECLASSSGVNIFVTNISSAIALHADRMQDDGNLSCGDIRHDPASNNRLLYSISYDQSVE